MDVDRKSPVRVVDDRAGDPLLAAPDSDPDRPQTWLVVRQSHLWQPPTDVFEFADQLIVQVEVAGMRDGTFHVALHDRRLQISGSRPRLEHEHAAQQFHRMEIGYGEFRVEVTLPWPVNRDQASAVYRDGFLYVELPRARNQQLYVVDVDVDQEPSETDKSG
ncbi:MAG: Hsp20/alpha crystallin family protein [Aggregatilineales bacterium]